MSVQNSQTERPSEPFSTIYHRFPQNIAILADVPNLFASGKNIGVKVDYLSLIKGITGSRNLVRAFAFSVEKNESHAKFTKALSLAGFENRVKKSTGRAESNLVSITLEAVRMAPKVDTICLVTGDRAYSELCSHLRSIGCRVEVYSIRDSAESVLRESADFYSDIPQELTFADTDKASDSQPPPSA